jgi:hypothetical protein
VSLLTASVFIKRKATVVCTLLLSEPRQSLLLKLAERERERESSVLVCFLA